MGKTLVWYFQSKQRRLKMPWNIKETSLMRLEFVEQALSKKFHMKTLCKKYGISLKTGYKWLKRYKNEGIEGLSDRSKMPRSRPNITSDEQVNLILQKQEQYPVWKARKLRQVLINEGYENIPSEATFNRILKKQGEMGSQDTQKRERFIRFEKEKPNELWQMDFKGYFRIGSDKCHPLTVLDDHSRFSITLQACKSENTEDVKQSLENAFREFGLPDAMTMDNGSPWKGGSTLSKLTIWLMKLGIVVSHSRPGHPQTQGKLERFHRSFKEEVLKYNRFTSLQEAQVYFNDWKHIYNYIRPHDGINLLCPAKRYYRSNRIYKEKLERIEYNPQDIVRKVSIRGCIEWNGCKYFVGEYFHGEYVAIRQTYEEDLYGIYFMNSQIGRIKKSNIYK